MEKKALRAHKVCKNFGDKAAVSDVDVEVVQGEIVGLLGPNGAGKTTTFYMMAGLIKADRGAITLDDEDVSTWPIHQRALKGVGYLPQEASVFRDLTVEENINAALEIHNTSRARRDFLLNKLLEDLGLKHIDKSKGRELSGGERRRVEIARALALRPQFILLDEPFAGVESSGRQRCTVHHRRVEKKEYRSTHHRPQRAGNSGHRGSCLHYEWRASNLQRNSPRHYQRQASAATLSGRIV